MLRPVNAVIVVLFVAASCASAPPEAAPAPAAAPAFDPVGTFDFSTGVDGQNVTGVITISRGTIGNLAAVLSTSATPEIPMQSVVAEGNRVTMRASTPDGAVAMILNFEGAAFTGSWSFGDLAGTMTGRRRQ